ncbi:MAG TPA: hypothetical protein VH370_20510 [Humisphaera sp.]|jgi:hypothetical protein|nr:hypothetical protein [Humisphaera sp.]
MPIIVTQRYSGSSLRKVSNAWVARESWNVTGTPDKSTAIEVACSHNLPHSINPNMRAGHRDASNYKGPLSWIVTADFTFGDHGACAQTPLDEPAKILAEAGIEMVPTDIDKDQNAILNSAGDPFDPPQSGAVHTLGLCVRLAVPFYNIQEAIKITDAVNSDPFELRGAGGVEPGQCHCRSYKPTEDYTENAPFVWVEYVFEFAEGVEPWQSITFDEGRNGWYVNLFNETVKGQICYNDGTPVNQDVRLDGTGKPMDPKMKIVDKDGKTWPPVNNPNKPPGIEILKSRSNATATSLIWRDKQQVPFTGLI